MRWNIRTWLLLTATSTGVAFWLGSVRAAGVPQNGGLVYAGVIQQGTDLPTGQRLLAVELYDASSAGTRLCRVDAGMVQVTSGRFRVPLDAEPDCLAAVRSNPELWVDVQVAGESVGRAKIGAVPYALEAKRASEVVAGAITTDGVAARAIDGTKLAATLVLPGGATVEGSQTHLNALEPRIAAIEALQLGALVPRVAAAETAVSNLQGMISGVKIFGVWKSAGPTCQDHCRTTNNGRGSCLTALGGSTLEGTFACSATAGPLLCFCIDG